MNDTKYLDLVIEIVRDWTKEVLEFLPSFGTGILVFAAFYYMSRFLSRMIVRVFQKAFPEGRNQDTIVAMIGVFRFFIILSGAFISLEIMGLNNFFMKFMGSLGVAGIIAGVALKDLVSSIFSGLLVGIDKSFKVGDQVTIKDISGTVEEIGFLTTKIINEEGKKVYIPNQLIFDAPFINISASAHRKVIIEMEIPVSENLEKAKKIIYDELTTLPYNEHPESSEVIFVKQNLGYFNIQIKFWMKQGENFAKIKSDALLKLKSQLDNEGIKSSRNNGE